MKNRFIVALVLSVAFTGVSLAQASETDQTHSPRFLVHLLDYLAKDYSGAVSSDGKVISQSEYNEQAEFAAEALKIGTDLKETQGESEITSQLRNLDAAVKEKQPPEIVVKLARDTQRRVIVVSGIEVYPNKWPDLKVGESLFRQNCVGCHGETGKGDGTGAASLKPPPANLTDRNRMKEISSFNAFNTIRLGVPGTAMVPFQSLSDQDVWALAFFATSIRFKGDGVKSEFPPGWDPTSQETLKSAASLSDEMLLQALPGSESDKEKTLSLLRNYSKGEDQNGYLALAKTNLLEAKADYANGNIDSAKSKSLKAYLEGIEPIEPRMKATDPDAVSILEGKMAAVRGAIDGRKSADEVNEAVLAAEKEIDSAGLLIAHKEMSSVVAFFAAFAILLREGFEAVLIILALLGVIRAAGSREAALWVHGGWISALGLGFVAWFTSGWLMALSGAGREMLEGCTSIFAVVVLLYVGFWLHSQSEIGRWKQFLEVKIKGFLHGKNLFGLAAIAFLAVFREAFETVLFLRAIWLEAGPSAKASLAAGVFTSLALVITLSWVALNLSKKLPLRQLFTVSSVIMLFLATILTGKGVHSLQETGLIGVTAIPIHFRSDLAGIFSTGETLGAQAFVIGLVLFLWQYGRRPANSQY
jgi:high-affinity iron transporter